MSEGYRMKSKKLSIIVYSCLRNNDMWSIFSFFFQKYWGDCNYPIYLLTDNYKANEDYVFDDVFCIDDNWSTMMKKAIKTASTPYVMLFMDDYLLTQNVNNADIENVLEIAEKEHAANVRLQSSYMIKPTRYENNKDCAVFLPGTAYSFSTQVGIWDSEFLMNHIKDGWSAWDFERIGSMECLQKEQPLLLYKKYLFPYIEAVRKGKWLPIGVRLCKNNGITLDYQKRKRNSALETLSIYTKAVIISVAPNLVLDIQNKLQK